MSCILSSWSHNFRSFHDEELNHLFNRDVQEFLRTLEDWMTRARTRCSTDFRRSNALKLRLMSSVMSRRPKNFARFCLCISSLIILTNKIPGRDLWIDFNLIAFADTPFFFVLYSSSTCSSQRFSIDLSIQFTNEFVIVGLNNAERRDDIRMMYFRVPNWKGFCSSQRICRPFH